MASVCLMAGAVLIDIGKALIGYVAAMALAIGIVFTLATLALSLWSLPIVDGIVLTSLWITILFRSVFPFPFLVYLIASIIGGVIGERYF